MRRTANRLMALTILAIFIAGQPPFARSFHIHREAPAGESLELTPTGEQEEHHHPGECPFCPEGQCSCSVSAVACTVPSPPLPAPMACLEHDISEAAVVYIPHVPTLPTPPPRS